jgi:hypothetical protein
MDSSTNLSNVIDRIGFFDPEKREGRSVRELGLSPIGFSRQGLSFSVPKDWLPASKDARGNWFPHGTDKPAVSAAALWRGE